MEGRNTFPGPKRGIRNNVPAAMRPRGCGGTGGRGLPSPGAGAPVLAYAARWSGLRGQDRGAIGHDAPFRVPRQRPTHPGGEDREALPKTGPQRRAGRVRGFPRLSPPDHFPVDWSCGRSGFGVADSARPFGHLPYPPVSTGGLVPIRIRGDLAGGLTRGPPAVRTPCPRSAAPPAVSDRVFRGNPAGPTGLSATCDREPSGGGCNTCRPQTAIRGPDRSMRPWDGGRRARAIALGFMR